MLSKIPAYRLIGLFIGLSIASNLLKITGVPDSPAYAIVLTKNVEHKVEHKTDIPARVDIWCSKFFKQQQRNLAAR